MTNYYSFAGDEAATYPALMPDAHGNVATPDEQVRETVERLTATPDWAEQTFATNLVYEPLCGELFRSQFVMQFAAPHGDFVTPVLFGIAEHDYERNLAYTMELFRLLEIGRAHV